MCPFATQLRQTVLKITKNVPLRSIFWVGVYTIFWKLSYIDSKAKAKETSLPDGFTENPI